jgi:hypothetical protein
VEVNLYAHYTPSWITQEKNLPYFCLKILGKGTFPIQYDTKKEMFCSSLLFSFA